MLRLDVVRRVDPVREPALREAALREPALLELALLELEVLRELAVLRAREAARVARDDAPLTCFCA